MSNHQGKVAFYTTTLGWVWPCGTLGQSGFRIFWSSISLGWNNLQFITIINIFLFIYSLHILSNIVEVHLVMICFHGDSHQWKETSEVITFSWVWSGKLSHVQILKNLPEIFWVIWGIQARQDSLKWKFS